MDALFASRCVEEARALTCAHLAGIPPFDLEPLIQHFGIVAVRERPLDRDACLRREGGRLFIDVNSMFPLVRRRLSVAHEIGHLIVHRCSPKPAPEWGHEDPVVEALCNRLAGTLLVPDWALEGHFEGAPTLGDWRSPIRCSTVIAAALRFKVSVDVIASRVFCELDLASGVAAVIWRRGENTQLRNSQRELRIATAWHHLQKTIYVPRNKTAPQNSVIRKAFENEGSFCAIEDLSLGGLKGAFAVEAAGFGSSSGHNNAEYARGVLSLISPPNPDLVMSERN